MSATWRVGVDVGGTFTDVVLAGPGGVVVEKLPSTPRNFAEATAEGVFAALRRAGAPPADLAELVHGTTVATNAILEQRGARTGLLTTGGFRDLLEIRPLRLPRLYDPLWVKPPPLVERALRFEVDERPGQPDLITLDMGGTTAKASIVEGGRVHHVSECEVGGGITIGNRLNRGGG